MLKEFTKSEFTVSKKTLEYDIYDTMHKMANSKIEAEDGQIWGEIEITPELCREIISLINESNFSSLEKKKLIDILKDGSRAIFLIV
ncbi:DUF6241 domain-containing protein [Caloramator sp. mosi_1]|nr:DUF6241 domain-containing protein [Caloramator sp. mosi_1]WDC85195.1 DUF6241 domain-containing protein [Caloramator sp. mosi_1]